MHLAHRTIFVAAAIGLVSAACTDRDRPGEEPAIGSTSQALSQPDDGAAPTATVESRGWKPYPHCDGGVKGDPLPANTATNDKCVTEKQQRPDYAALMQEKQGMKAEPAANALVPPPAAPETLQRQTQFLDMVQSKQAELDALGPAQREAAYSKMKEEFFTENEVTP